MSGICKKKKIAKLLKQQHYCC